MAKTVVVRVGSLKKHEKYQKFYKVSKKYKAHDDKDEYKAGDVVIIQETRPMSKEKRWRVVELVKRPVGKETEDANESELPANKSE